MRSGWSGHRPEPLSQTHPEMCFRGDSKSSHVYNKDELPQVYPLSTQHSTQLFILPRLGSGDGSEGKQEDQLSKPHHLHSLIYRLSHFEFAYTYVCAPHACLPCRVQKRSLDSLELELQMITELVRVLWRKTELIDCVCVCAHACLCV